ncbi:hypothetical protein Saro_2545 [Novosphingobium aromaticivorans DSM 12444]|uniref:Sugar transporter n=2 Tax=Novosphingobium aromaticivorans TaxID=48935 RepID=Q2G592_NOVAD|nr:hypothetical protein Saro_2545 [Novosphingobium aromaticivorans DSM 12444]SCY47080.1 hypothetical protein SAMN05660666_01799 [Novosphingobium aromaticivorans]
MLHESALSRHFDDINARGILSPQRKGRGAMQETTHATHASHAPRTPGHLWIVGTVGLIWNSFGCVDYAMTKLDPAGYAASMGEGVLAYVESLPAWLSVFWALGVWGSLAGSILLLLRSRHAARAFIVSLAGFVVTQGYQHFGSEMPSAMKGPGAYGIALAILVALVFQLAYARRMAEAGVLR